MRTHTHKHTHTSGVPGPKLDLCKILLFLRLFVTAVPRHVRECKEEEGEGAAREQRRRRKRRRTGQRGRKRSDA